ncbi:unnamed protein product [Hymenolepis diminuta]|uniref:Uncharacterized protein n=1 Tax=Hymenolepis diminuta TaxID=6216 RepID=A0A564YD02_HYMDI|nr:unnamed protein product [Hymenolepis diminuta]
MEMSVKEMQTDPIKVSTVMHTKFPASNSDGFSVVSGEGHVRISPLPPQSLSVNADTDASVETHQTIVKSPWTESLANGRPAYIFHLGPMEAITRASEDINKNHLI